jgi:alpha-ketoglutarate-dependent taurine dioxygenase
MPSSQVSSPETATRSPRGPAAWRAQDLHGISDFVHTLSPPEIADLDGALSTLKSTGQHYLDTDGHDLPLPHLDRAIASLYEEVKDGAGFVIFRGVPVDRYTKDEVRAAAWAIACRFGRPVSQNAKGVRIADVMDVIKGASSPRGYHSNAELRPHSDPASDLIGLCCIEAAKEGGDSMLANAVAIHERLAQTRPELLAVLHEGFRCSRFGEGLADDPEVTDYKVPLLSVVDGFVSCRSGRNRIEGAAEALNTPLTELQNEALSAFGQLANSPEFSITFRMDPGDFMIANNLTLLHARTNFVDNDDTARPRHLLRFWLEGRQFRPIRPELNFFNRGQCGILPKDLK